MIRLQKNHLPKVLGVLTLIVMSASAFGDYGDAETTDTMEYSVPIASSKTARYWVRNLEFQRTFRPTLDSSYRFVINANSGVADKNAGKPICLGPKGYFTEDGTLGIKGKRVRRELVGMGRSTAMAHMFFENDFPKMKALCPKFSRFNHDQRLNFWIWYIASIARVESECGRNGYRPGDPNGSSVGEMQMPLNYKDVRDWRGLRGDGAGGCEAKPPPTKVISRTYGSKAPTVLMANFDNNMGCAVEVLAGVLCGFYVQSDQKMACQSTTQRPYGHGFWASLKDGDRPNSSLEKSIAKNIKEFPLCN